MGSHKAPGLDGFNGNFYRTNWHTIGNEVIGAVQQFFHTGKMIKEFNQTLITLIPKVPQPSR